MLLNSFQDNQEQYRGDCRGIAKFEVTECLNINVIDKYIIQDDDLSIKLINHMIENKLIGEMISDQYGNYVIQKALNVTSGPLFMNIIKQIQLTIETLKQSNIGRKIYDHLMRKYGDYFRESIIKE